jgi:5-methylcytosine-specific restriction endonuclease McrA
MSEGWKNGSTRAWRALRKQILERDQYRCQLQLEGCRTLADCVHHIHGKTVTGDHPQYLVAACTPCNLKVGDPQGPTKKDPPFTPHKRWW